MCRKPSCILPCRKKAINQEHFKAVAMVRALYPTWYISDHDLWDRRVQCFSQEDVLVPVPPFLSLFHPGFGKL